METIDENTQTGRKSFYDEIIVGKTEKFIPKKVKSIHTEIIEINPEKARHILKYYNNTRDTPNRKPSKVVVTKYATDMRNGDWKMTGEPILFSSNGDLLSGQHRLLACIEADIPIKFVMTYGVAKGAIEAIDNGKTRTYGDVASLRGITDPIMTTSLARAIMAYESSGVFDVKSDKRFRTPGINQITKSQTMAFIEKNPNIITFLERYRKNNVVSPVVAAFCYWRLSKDKSDVAKNYLDSVLMGYDIQPDTIQAYVFSKLQRNRNALQTKMSKTAIIANIFEGYRRVAGYSKSKSLQITWDVRNGLPTIP